MANGIFDVETMIALERQKRAQNAQNSVPVSAEGLMQGINVGGQSPMGSGAVSAPQPMMTPQPAIPAPPPAQKPGMMDRIRGGLKDPATMAGLAAAFNQMTLNPNAQLQTRASDLMALRTARQESNQTVDYLRSEGRDDLADMVQANPSMAAEVLKGLATAKSGGFMRKPIGDIKTDPVSGQLFYTEFDPNVEGGAKRVNVEGAFGQTPQQVQDMALELQAIEADQKAGYKQGEILFDKFQLVDKNISDLYRVGELAGEGALTGFINKFLPATNAATAELRQITKGMGIDVIKSVTFGALSEKEMGLAMEVAFPPNLKGRELAEYIKNKIRAQEKLRDALMPEVQMLLGNSGLKAYSDYKIKNVKRHQAAARAFERMQKSSPELTREMWKLMNLEAREAYIAAEDAKK